MKENPQATVARSLGGPLSTFDLRTSAFRRRRLDWFLWLGVAYLVALVGIAILVPIFGPEYTKSVGAPFQPSGGKFLLGTDELGRDVFARLAYGARLSLFIGLTVQGIAILVGVTVGIIGTFAPKWIRVPLLRFTDGMFAFPDILLAVLLIAVFGMGVKPVIAALAITAWPGISRIVVTQVASLKDREFVVAAKALGASTFYVSLKHILPQLWGILLAVGMVELAGTILAESTLSFLGIGVQAPMPSWGGMINQARINMQSHPEMLIWPCLFLSATIFALNFVGDGLRAALDPRSK
jgi:ABC-type dipeptide/oligopeptide/nickel transport system permease subunit